MRQIRIVDGAIITIPDNPHTQPLLTLDRAVDRYLSAHVPSRHPFEDDTLYEHRCVRAYWQAVHRLQLLLESTP